MAPGMRVLVVGLGVTGDAVVRHCRARGDDVVVWEDTWINGAQSSGAGVGGEGSGAVMARFDAAIAAGARLVASEAPASHAFLAALGEAVDLVVPSPGVPERHPVLVAAREHGVRIRSEIDLAAEVLAAQAVPATLVAVTGTNGKTTVATLTAEILGAAGVRVAAAGNIGRPLLDAVGDALDVVVAEVSSFQLEYTEVFRPRAAALLNLGADHLDWHRTYEAYGRAKAKMFAHQADDDVLVFNADDPAVAALAAQAPARRVPFSTSPNAASGYRVVDAAVGPLLVGPDDEELIALGALPRHTPVDVANALAAAALALDVGAGRAAVAETLGAFGGLPHRMQEIACSGGVRYIDDSKATNPHATLAAARDLEGIVLIAGGRNKGLDLRELRALAPQLRAVIAIGEAADEVCEAFSGVVGVSRSTSMHDAVRRAAEIARSGDTVLLSPACASLDWYSSYSARGDDFAREVLDVMEVQG